jgi:hypothetical protein
VFSSYWSRALKNSFNAWEILRHYAATPSDCHKSAPCLGDKPGLCALQEVFESHVAVKTVRGTVFMEPVA